MHKRGQNKPPVQGQNQSSGPSFLSSVLAALAFLFGDDTAKKWAVDLIRGGSGNGAKPNDNIITQQSLDEAMNALVNSVRKRFPYAPERTKTLEQIIRQKFEEAKTKGLPQRNIDDYYDSEPFSIKQLRTRRRIR